MSSTVATEHNPARLLAAQALSSGILTVTNAKLKRVFCIRRGKVIFARSNIIEEQFDETLVRDGLLTRAQQKQVKAAATKAGAKLSMVLRDSGLQPPETIERAIADHVRSLLAASLAVPTAQATFTKGQPNLDNELTTAITCAELVLHHTQTPATSMDKVRASLEGSAPRPTPRLAKLLEGWEPDPITRHLAACCDGERQVAALLESAGGDAGKTLRTLYGLQLLGGIEIRTAVTETAASGVTRVETMALLERAEATNHYVTLGLGSTATQEEIRGAYYTLARRFHPDRFRTGDLQDLFEPIEKFFTRVTEAHNTLSHLERRKQYDKEQQDKISQTIDKQPELDAQTLARQNFAKARILTQRNQLAQAVVFLENAVQLDESKPAYHLELGRLLTRNPRRRDDAEEALQRTLQLDPTLIDGYVALARLCLRTDRQVEAKKLLRQAISLDANHAEARALLEELGGKGADDKGLFGGLFKR